jgi:hypothetical protein
MIILNLAGFGQHTFGICRRKRGEGKKKGEGTGSQKSGRCFAGMVLSRVLDFRTCGKPRFISASIFATRQFGTFCLKFHANSATGFACAASSYFRFSTVESHSWSKTNPLRIKNVARKIKLRMMATALTRIRILRFQSTFQ